MSKYRMQEPYGYMEENDYSSLRTAMDNEIATNRETDKKLTEESFAQTEYDKEQEAVIFKNSNGEAVGKIDMTDIVASALIKDARYDSETQQLIIEFDNGDIVSIDMKDLINFQEAGDGLDVVDNKFVVKVADDSEEFLKVTSDGVKNVGIQDAIDSETERATAAESAITDAMMAGFTRLDQEISNILDSIDDEEARAISAETALNGKIESETSERINADSAIDNRITSEIANVNSNINSEKTDRENADTEIIEKINDEISARTAAYNLLSSKIDDEISRANNAETIISNAKADKVNAVSTVEYDSNNKEINFKNINGDVISRVDATDFIKDGMVKNVKIENNNLVIEFNTDSGIEDIEIPLTDIFDPNNYYTKSDINDIVTDLHNEDFLIDGKINASVSALTEAIENEENARIAADELKADKTELPTKVSELTNDAGYLTEHQDLSEYAKTADVNEQFNGYYTKDEVDALITAKENEIYNLTKIVGDMGGNVTYELPNELGKSFNTLMNNNGTVKLTEDTVTGRFGPGITAKNAVKLNLNSHNLTITGLTESSSQAAIMSRGTQEITIGGNGVIDAGQGMCIEANGASSVINLTGSTSVYVTDRPNAELVYCYAGTINISGGTFKNNGSKYLLNCYDANYINGTAKIIVTGGKFYDFNPADNSAEGEHTSFVAEGYHVETSVVTEDGVEHTVYTVKKDA